MASFVTCLLMFECSFLLSVPQDDFDSIRPLCYKHTDVFIVCFSVVSPASFASIRGKWLPEIRRSLREKLQQQQQNDHNSASGSAAIPPFILVGTQCDLRHDVKVLIELDAAGQKPIATDHARAVAARLGAMSYIECSALTQKNLKVGGGVRGVQSFKLLMFVLLFEIVRFRKSLTLPFWRHLITESRRGRWRRRRRRRRFRRSRFNRLLRESHHHHQHHPHHQLRMRGVLLEVVGQPQVWPVRLPLNDQSQLRNYHQPSVVVLLLSSQNNSCPPPGIILVNPLRRHCPSVRILSAETSPITTTITSPSTTFCQTLSGRRAWRRFPTPAW